jgi:RNA polymerase sigma factor (sigma-70 family)
MTDPDVPLRTTVVELDSTPGSVAEAAVLEAWDRYRDEVFGFLVDATRESATAEDLLQDAYVRLLREARAGRMPQQPRAWLYRVAANLAVDRGRRLLSARRWLDRVGIPAYRRTVGEPPDRRLERRQAFEDLDTALAGLPPDARTALLLSAEGFSGREIATAIGRSETATRTMLSRARLRVRNRLTGEGGES